MKTQVTTNPKFEQDPTTTSSFPHLSTLSSIIIATVRKSLTKRTMAPEAQPIEDGERSTSETESAKNTKPFELLCPFDKREMSTKNFADDYCLLCDNWEPYHTECCNHCACLCRECMEMTTKLKLLRCGDNVWRPLVTDDELKQSAKTWLVFHAVYFPVLFHDVLLSCLAVLDGDELDWDSLKGDVLVAAVHASDAALVELLVFGTTPAHETPHVLQAVQDCMRKSSANGSDGRVNPAALMSNTIRIASRYGRVECLRLLLGDGRVDPSAEYNCAVRWASQNGHAECLKLLLSDDCVDPSEDGNYAVRWASENGHVECVKLLLSDDRVDPSTDNSAVREASKNGHVECVKLLLSDDRVDPSAWNNYAVQLASENGHVECVKLLLSDDRVDPSANDNKAIRAASENGHVECVKFLLRDDRVDPIDGINAEFQGAVSGGHIDRLAMLLSDDRVDPSADENCSVRWASFYGHAECVKLLLSDYRVDPSADDNYAVRWASRNGHVECVKLLLSDDRVDPSAGDNIAIRLASEKGHVECVKLLLSDDRVDSSADDNYAVREASRWGHVECVRLLLSDDHVDPSAKDNHAVRVGCENGHFECAKLLLSDDRVDPSADDNAAIRQASGHSWRNTRGCVELLLSDPRVDPTARRNEAIREAAKLKNFELVKMLAGDVRVQGDLDVLRHLSEREDVCDTLLKKNETLQTVMFENEAHDDEYVVDEKLMDVVNKAHSTSKTVGMLCMGAHLNENAEREVLDQFCGLAYGMGTKLTKRNDEAQEQ